MITWEEFKANTKPFISNKYQETNVSCPACGQPLYKRTDMVLTTYPPQYRYECLYCHWVGTSY